MDYSLVVGVDQEKRELVVGIVDYIRTFTWDKKLESWVKDSAFLGGAKGEPTIVTPKQCLSFFAHRIGAELINRQSTFQSGHGEILLSICTRSLEQVGRGRTFGRRRDCFDDDLMIVYELTAICVAYVISNEIFPLEMKPPDTLSTSNFSFLHSRLLHHICVSARPVYASVPRRVRTCPD